jgi:HEAT repeat protein
MDIVHSIEDVKSFFASIPQPVSPEVQANAVPHTEKRTGISGVVALGSSSDPSVIPELIDFTTSENGNERRLAASALGKLARFKPEIYKAVEALEGLLADEKPQVRQYSLKALARIGRVNKERLQPIIEDPEEKDYNVSLARRLIKKTRV